MTPNVQHIILAIQGELQSASYARIIDGAVQGRAIDYVDAMEICNRYYEQYKPQEVK